MWRRLNSDDTEGDPVMRLKLAAALAALPLLGACAPQFESTVYVRDIDDVLASGKALAIPATLRVPQSGADTCKEKLAELVENLGKLTPISGEGKCIEDDGDAFAELETSVTIEPPGAAAEDETPLFTIAIAEGATAGTHDLVFAMNKSLADVVEAVDAAESSTDFDPARFTLVVSNDGNRSVEMTPGEVFLDDKAVMPPDGPVTLDRRHDATIRLSDVASRYVAEGNGYHFATISER
jgi:hypothetical protein